MGGDELNLIEKGKNYGWPTAKSAVLPVNRWPVRQPEPAGMPPVHDVNPGYYNSEQILQLLDLHKADANAAIPLRIIPKGLNH